MSLPAPPAYTPYMKLSSRMFPIPLLLLAVILPLVLYGARAAGSAPSTPPRVNTLMEILALIEERHTPQTDPKKIVYAGIQGMLSTLDPHSNFFDEEAFREMREEQKGAFYGLGIVINKPGRYQPLRVVAPIADTPAARLGIRAGDVITHIRDASADVDVETLGLTISEAVRHLRGPKGSEVEITIDRPGLKEPLVFKIARDAVKTPAVNQAFMIRPGIGYIHIANFSETTAFELDRALEQLDKQGAKKLLLDLQGNPGGILEQAIAVSSRFLDPNDLVVYTEGREPGSRQNFNARRESNKIDWPVVVLINRGSASASEIVAGALQDHDRAVIVGETSFGKGLVQSVFPLSENTGLALTTQKYYTPSGRSIQRPYASNEDEYYLENFQRDAVPKPADRSHQFNTETGRQVFGGGGITPDIAAKEPELAETEVELARLSAFSQFVNPLPAEKRTLYAADREKLFADFVHYAATLDSDFQAVKLETCKAQLLLRLKAELALLDGGMTARDRVLLESSVTVAKALTALEDSEKLLASRKKAQLLRRQTIQAARNEEPGR